MLPVFERIGLFFPVFFSFMTVSAKTRTKYSKFRRFAPSVIRFDNFDHILLPENREEIIIFAYTGGGINKGFWPKY